MPRGQSGRRRQRSDDLVRQESPMLNYTNESTQNDFLIALALSEESSRGCGRKRQGYGGKYRGRGRGRGSQGNSVQSDGGVSFSGDSGYSCTSDIQSEISASERVMTTIERGGLDVPHGAECTQRVPKSNRGDKKKEIANDGQVNTQDDFQIVPALSGEEYSRGYGGKRWGSGRKSRGRGRGRGPQGNSVQSDDDVSSPGDSVQSEDGSASAEDLLEDARRRGARPKTSRKYKAPETKELRRTREDTSFSGDDVGLSCESHTTSVARSPSTNAARPPSTSAARPPSTSVTRPPSTSVTRPPSTSAARPPSTSVTRPPSTSAARPPSTIGKTERRPSTRGRSKYTADFPDSSAAYSQKLMEIYNEKVAIPQCESAETTRMVTPLAEKVLSLAKQHVCFKRMKILNTGSHFEHLKVGKADEIDIMFCLSGVPGQYEKLNDPPDCRCFMRVKVDESCDEWREYCTQDGYLSTRLLREDFETIVAQAIKEYKVPDFRICKEDSDSEICPATKLIFYKKRGRKPLLDVDFVIAIEVNRRNWMEGYSQWNLSPWYSQDEEEKLKQNSFHLVTKMPPTGHGLAGLEAESMWRISYSLLEKKILYSADSRSRQLDGATEDYSNKTCRKACLRLLKLLRENLREKSRMAQRYYESFPSYFLKTALLHNMQSSRYRSEEWTKDLLYDRLVELLGYVVYCIKKRDLRHFFLRDHNLMVGLDAVTCEALVKRYQRVLDLLKENKLEKIF